MAQQRPIRVLLAKCGLDGHDRGIKVISLGLKDEVMDVIYSGLHQSPEEIVTKAVEDNVDVIGISSLSGGYNTFLPEVARLVKENSSYNILIIGGGIILEEDIPFLKEKGIDAIFGPGTPIKEIADFIRQNLSSKTKEA